MPYPPSGIFNNAVNFLGFYLRWTFMVAPDASKVCEAGGELSSGVADASLEVQITFSASVPCSEECSPCVH